MSALSNRREKDKKRRAKLRKRLEAAGVPEEQIEQIIALRREDDRSRRHRINDQGPTREEILANTDDSLWPDDTRYRPSSPDPLLHGPARVSGITAKVIKRRETVTEYQFDRMRETK